MKDTRGTFKKKVDKIRHKQAIEFTTKEVKTVHKDTGIDEIVEIMKDMDVKILPVLDNGGRLVGKIRKSDLMKRFVHPHSLGSEKIFGIIMDLGYFAKTAADLMRKYKAVVRKDTKVEKICQLMVNEAVSSLPVVEDDGRFVGIVYAETLLKALDEK
jgi:CBS domain-containing protein